MRDKTDGNWRSRLQATGASSEADHDAFGASVAALLRSPEPADPALADRIMAAVREEARRARQNAAAAGRGVPWWRRSIAVRVTPLAGLALAAGLAAIMVASDRLSAPARAGGESRAVAAGRDTVHVVRFVLVAPGASSVAVVGDFNGWDANAHRLVQAGARGAWSASVPLTEGRHEYAFVIDGTRWVTDPGAAPAIADEFGGESSVVTVGRTDKHRSS